MKQKDRAFEEMNSDFEVIKGGQRGVQSIQDTDDETEIDLVELGLVLLDKLHYIIFFFLLGAVILNAYSFFCIKPTYESIAKMYIVSASDDTVVDLTDLNIGAQLTADYEELMLSYPVLEQVIDRMDLNMDYTELAQMISIDNPADTRILAVKVISEDPELSRDIANTVVNVSVNYLPKTMGTDEPNIAQDARAPLKKADPSYLKFTLIGALLGTFLCCAYIIIRYLLDDTIHTAEDMEKYFGIVPLTTIPDIASLDEGKEKTGKLFVVGGKK